VIKKDQGILPEKFQVNELFLDNYQSNQVDRYFRK